MAPKKPARVPVGDKTPKPRPLGRELSAALQAAAEARYVYNDLGVSLKDIGAQPLFNGVPHSKLVQWANEGDWHAQRKAYLTRLKAKVEQAISGGLVQQRMDQLRLYDKLHAQLSAHILPDAHGHIHTQPKSFESALAALMKLDEHRARYQREISDSVGDTMTRNAPSAATAQAYDPAMAQRMAHAFMAAQIQADGASQVVEAERPDGSG